MTRMKGTIFALALMRAAWAAFAHPAGMTPDQGLTFGIV